MNRIQKKRLYWIVAIIFVVFLGFSLIIYALKENINLYLTPSQTYEQNHFPSRIMRVGGMVKEHSLHHENQGIKVYFDLTDFQKELRVEFSGILPDLFREKQGIIVQGHLLKPGYFQADEVLAKHDENYMPPNLLKAKR